MSFTVYFLKPVDLAGPIKIGISWDFDNRLRVIQCDSPVELEVLAKVDAQLKDENVLHRMFGDLNVRGSWYRPDERLLLLISKLREGAPLSSVIDRGCITRSARSDATLRGWETRRARSSAPRAAAA